MAKRISCGFLVLLVLAGAGAFAWWTWLKGEITPMPAAPPFYVRFETETTLLHALETLKADGVVKNPSATDTYARLNHKRAPIPTGTYQVNAGMTAEDLFVALHKPIDQMVRLPETNWSARTANVLEMHGVAKADEYMALVHQPQLFESYVDFPMPKDSLEGYLYPDTYDLPPLLGAKDTIVKQLEAFQAKVYDKLNHPANLQRLLTIASMVELEAKMDDDRPKIAGVIANRLNKKMRLQIDATILYGIQKWRPLTLAEYHSIKTPYNTYENDGLPPGPICSPSLKSVEAALHPDTHNYLFYVAQPNGYHLFASDLAGHDANIAKVKRERALALKVSP